MFSFVLRLDFCSPNTRRTHFVKFLIFSQISTYFFEGSLTTPCQCSVHTQIQKKTFCGSCQKSQAEKATRFLLVMFLPKSQLVVFLLVGLCIKHIMHS